MMRHDVRLCGGCFVAQTLLIEDMTGI